MLELNSNYFNFKDISSIVTSDRYITIDFISNPNKTVYLNISNSLTVNDISSILSLSKYNDFSKENLDFIKSLKTQLNIQIYPKPVRPDIPSTGTIIEK